MSKSLKTTTPISATKTRAFPRTTGKLAKLERERNTGKLDRAQYQEKLEKVASALPNIAILLFIGGVE